MATIEIPDFNFAGMYYPQIFESLIRYKRGNCPELTDESKFEPAMQLLSAYALVKHLDSVQIDMVAKESFLRTAELPESVREHLRLIGYEMRSASPAKAAMLFELSKVLTVTTTIVPEGSKVATEGSDAIFYEADAEVSTVRTDRFTTVFAVENGVYTDRTTNANSANHPADDWTPWATPAVNDAIYMGHSGVMWNRVKSAVTTPGDGITGVWEYYDGNWAKARPDLVTNLGATLEFELNEYLYAYNRTGLTVRVMLNSTKTYEDAVVTWDGSTNKVEIGLLGQAVASTDPEDYTVGAQWEIISRRDITVTNDTTFTLPQSETQEWQIGTVNGVAAFWLRFRIVAVAVPTGPVMAQMTMHEGKQYVVATVTQGKSQVDNPLGSGDGTPDQRFKLSQENVIDGSYEVSVGGIIWDQVSDFLSSGPDDEVYRIELGENDSATVVFAPVGQGKAPPVGVNNIAAAYRYGADVDGNVGANTIVVDKSGLTLVNRVWNPRQAFGWSEAQGASASSLEKAKQLGPASLRTLNGVAISPDDVVTLTLNFEDDEGSSPFSRAVAVEELFGPKTIGLIVVASGGGLASADVLEEVELYFNGDKFAAPPLPKHLIANQEVTAINYEPVPIDVSATVTAKGITQQQIVNALSALLNPEAKDENDEWLWNFGDNIPASRIHAEIHGVNKTAISKVVLNGWIDVQLGASQLPVAGTLAIEVIDG